MPDLLVKAAQGDQATKGHKGWTELAEPPTILTLSKVPYDVAAARTPYARHGVVPCRAYASAHLSVTINFDPTGDGTPLSGIDGSPRARDATD